MSDRVDAAGAAQFRRMPSPEEGGAAAAEGSWRGEAVRIPTADLQSLLADAKEELTFAHSERIESKEIEERAISEGGEDRVERVEHIQELMDQLPDLSPEELELFRAALQASRATAEEVLRQVRERFPDPSHAHAALRAAEEGFRAAGDTEMADRIAEAAARQQTEEGPAIRAGLNVTRAAMDIAGGDRQAARDLRDSYRETVFGRSGPAGVYKGIVDRFGVEGFAGQVKFLTRALGDDLIAAGPSVERPQLRELLENLSALRTIDTAHDRCQQLAGRVQRLCGTAIQPTAVMQRLLPLTEEVVSGGGKIAPIPVDVGVPARRLDAQILFLREAREVMAMLPPGIYRDLDARFGVLNGMQDAMDRLIEREEEA